MSPDDKTEPQLRIGRVTEADFDRIVAAAGGKRWSEISRTTHAPNADYLLDGAVCELKLIEEEGLEKSERQRRLAELFRRYQQREPVVVLDPTCLDTVGERRYFKIVAGPIQTAMKKASKQLESTKTDFGADLTRVVIAINNGYTALTHDEFTHIVLKSARNDTQNIDTVIIGGVYYYTDEFDYYALFPFEEHPINIARSCSSFERLKKQWDVFADNTMTAVLQGKSPPDRADKMPVVDIAFDVDNITFVKPALRMGVPSRFWGAERPRRNSTGLTRCPPVGMTFPDLDETTWEQLRSLLGPSGFLKENFVEWRQFRERELSKARELREPLVPIPITYDGFVAWCSQAGTQPTETYMLAYAARLFDDAVREILRNRRLSSDLAIVPARYIYVETHEIGQDRVYDYSSISLVTEEPHGRRTETLVQFARFFHEHAIVLGSAYAIKFQVHVLVHERIRTHAWV